jgi:hypothetical protein
MVRNRRFMERNACPIPVGELGVASLQKGDIDEEDHRQLTRGCNDPGNGGRDHN